MATDQARSVKSSQVESLLEERKAAVNHLLKKAGHSSRLEHILVVMHDHTISGQHMPRLCSAMGVLLRALP